jgi:hypothetical protein
MLFWQQPPPVHVEFSQHGWPGIPHKVHRFWSPQARFGPVQTPRVDDVALLMQHGCPASLPQARQVNGEVRLSHLVLGAVHAYPQHLSPSPPQRTLSRTHAPDVQVPSAPPHIPPLATQNAFTQQPPVPQTVPGQQASPGRPHEGPMGGESIPASGAGTSAATSAPGTPPEPDGAEPPLPA